MSDEPATWSIGFAGLGQMGRHIAANLMRPDTRLLVSARRPELREAFRARGAAVTDRNADLAGCDAVFLCLPDGAALREVVLGEGGIAAGLRPGAAVVDLGTSDHGSTLEVAAALEQRGASFLDAPISGLESRAEAGTLTVMCGGPAPLFERMLPMLQRIGSTILHMGPTGSGQLTKLVNQLLYDINMAALAEIMPMAASLGLDPAQLTAVVNSGTGRSHASEYFLPRILAGRFTESYPLQAAYKDLVAGAELGARRCLPMPVLGAATATYQAALRQGLGAQDKGAMIQVFENLLGVRFRAAPEGETAA